MRLQVPAKENRAAATRVVRQDIGDFVRTRRTGIRPQLDAKQEQALRDLRGDGIAVVEGYWPRERAFGIRDRLTQELERGGNHDYDNGAYLRFQDNAAYDEGVRRLYHVERVVPELAELRHDPFALEVAAAYYRMPFHSGLLMYQYNTQSNANTRYYHVDSFSKESKAFLYLDDVDEGNGPFTYLLGSHRSRLTRIRRQVMGNPEGADTTFDPNEVSRRQDRELQVCGPAGTLILADVRGLHRGSPQLDRDRSVLVNYLHPQPGDLYPAK
jgi:hypothetical protein